MGERSLDVRFTWEFNEWELDLEVDFLHILESDRPSMENGDRMRWKLKKNGDFDIRSFYNELRGCFFVTISLERYLES